MFRIEVEGERIYTLGDWFRLAPPARGSAQWKDLRSAKETARRWLAGYPTEVEAALNSHTDTAGFVPLSVEPEYATALDEFPSPRNHDLVVEGAVSSERALVCVESKADEPCDRIISARLAEVGSGSNLPERVKRRVGAVRGGRA